MLKDIFGGTCDESRQRVNGHFWVALDTPQEHCMACRRGPTSTPCDGLPYCICGHLLDEHQKSYGNPDTRPKGACRSPCSYGKGEIPDDELWAADMKRHGVSPTPRCTCERFTRAVGPKPVIPETDPPDEGLQGVI